MCPGIYLAVMPRTVFTSVLFLALMQFEPLPGQNFESIAKRIARSVVKVTAFDQGRAITAGNGFFVASDGFVVTDRQVIGDYKTIVIETADGIKHMGISVEATDAVHGLVLLRIADVSGPALTLGSPKPGERVAVIALAKPIASGLISDVVWAPTRITHGNPAAASQRACLNEWNRVDTNDRVRPSG